jgi:hypothetical protein
MIWPDCFRYRMSVVMSGVNRRHVIVNPRPVLKASPQYDVPLYYIMYPIIGWWDHAYQLAHVSCAKPRLVAPVPDGESRLLIHMCRHCDCLSQTSAHSQHANQLHKAPKEGTGPNLVNGCCCSVPAGKYITVSCYCACIGTVTNHREVSGLCHTYIHR